MAETSLKPNRKITTGALAGALTAILVSMLGQVGYTVSGELASSLTVVFTFLTSYFVSEAG